MSRRTVTVVVVAVVAFVAVVVAGLVVFRDRWSGSVHPPAAAPSTVDSAAPQAQSPGPPGSLPGVLVYLKVSAGAPIEVMRYGRGVLHPATFGTATESDVRTASASPDGTLVAVVESPVRGQPGDLVVIEENGRRRTIAHDVAVSPGDGGLTWTTNSHTVVTSAGIRYDAVTGARGSEGLGPHRGYLVYSPGGTWRAYAATTSSVAVSQVDGSGPRTVPLPDCQDTTCPYAVQAVSDDGRYVALGAGSAGSVDVTEGHTVLDTRSGRPVPLGRLGNVRHVWFPSGGGALIDSGTQLIAVDANWATTAVYAEPAPAAGATRISYSN
jgi:hypothetical protein